MSDLRYRVMVITHGPDRTLSRTLASFQKHVRPQPTEWWFWSDGPMGRKAALDWEFREHQRTGSMVWHSCLGSWKQEGFCSSTRQAWKAAAKGEEVDFVFWLEHDFEFQRDVDMEEVAAVLDGERGGPDLFQVSLMRDPVNENEKAAGGLVASRPGEYEQRDGWLCHASYLTTTPNLMHRWRMEAWPWPEDDRECEGRFGLDLIDSGYYFGVMGNGEPWVHHIGVRDGFGY